MAKPKINSSTPDIVIPPAAGLRMEEISAPE
jgi:hypothetical protein